MEEQRGGEHVRSTKYAKFSPWTWIFLGLSFFILVTILGLTGRTLYLQNNRIDNEDDGDRQPFECLKNRGCRNWNLGYDITGVTNYVVYTVLDIPDIDSPCDCLQLCQDQAATCNSWAWKFTESGTGRRSCVLSSGINLPDGVVLNFATSPSALPISENPQIGTTVPRCLGYTLSPSSTDDKCVSGLSMLLTGGGSIC